MDVSGGRRGVLGRPKQTANVPGWWKSLERRASCDSELPEGCPRVEMGILSDDVQPGDGFRKPNFPEKKRDEDLARKKGTHSTLQRGRWARENQESS